MLVSFPNKLFVTEKVVNEDNSLDNFCADISAKFPLQRLLNVSEYPPSSLGFPILSTEKFSI